MENIIAKIKKQYTGKSVKHMNQFPCHLLNVVTLELIKQVHSDQEQHHKQVHVVSEQSIPYSGLFLKQCEPKRQKLSRYIILVEGEAGVGKSILCTLIIDDWASERQFQEFSIVLFLPLYQHSVVSVCSLLELVTELYELNQECCSSLANFLEFTTSNILIIADGWDQLVKLCEPEE